MCAFLRFDPTHSNNQEIPVVKDNIRRFTMQAVNDITVVAAAFDGVNSGPLLDQTWKDLALKR